VGGRHPREGHEDGDEGKQAAHALDMAHQHYTPHDQALFDKAVLWRGKQLGQV
jgi:hypothetical protein